MVWCMKVGRGTERTMVKKESVKEPEKVSSGRDVTLVFTTRENGELKLIAVTSREEAEAHAEQYGAILVDAQQFMPHLT